jgi:hypothetical protein
MKMTGTRRQFLKSGPVLAAGLAGRTSPAFGQQGRNQIDSIPDSEIKIPKIKFGKTEISRLILGVNPFYGFSHFNRNFGFMMQDWYTQARVLEVLRRSEALGINAFNYVHANRGQADWERYLAEGGKMQLVAQATTEDPAEVVSAVKPMAAWVQGEITDRAYRNGRLETVRDYAKKMRDLGVAMVGIGSHIPEVLMRIEDLGWDVDFYAGCAYNIRRTPEEFRKLLGGELPELQSNIFLQDDPPRMYRFMRQTKKPCVAYKILAAGRVSNPEQAFRRAFESIKPTDFVCVGMFPCEKDEVKEDAYYTGKYGVTAS